MRLLTSRNFGSLFFASLIAICLLVSKSSATQLVDVYLPDRGSRIELLQNDFDVVEMHQHSAAVVAWPGDMERLAALGLVCEVRITDLEEHYRSRLDSHLDDMGGYATLSEIQEWMNDKAEQYPDLVLGPIEVGLSHEDRALLALKISANPDVDEDEPEIFINAAIHAREVVTPLTIMNFVDILLEGYGTDPRCTELLDSREIWVMPVVNPDGYSYNEETNPNGGGMWRKNKYRQNNVLYGVDLNRNFPYMWGLDNEGSSPNPSSQTFRGPSAGSEPETQAVMDFINGRHFSAVLNYHSYSNLILIPWGYSYERPPTYPVYFAFGNYLNETLGWVVGGAEVIYLTNGDAQDWQESAADYHMWNFTFEVGSNSDGFWPSLARRDILVDEQVEPLFRFCEVGAHPQILLPPPRPFVLATDITSQSITLFWPPAADTLGNVAVEYDVAELSGELNLDDAEVPERYSWEMNGFVHQPNGGFGEGLYSYYSGSGNNLQQTMTTLVPYRVQPSDTLFFDTRFEIEENWDYAYVQASTDGFEFVNLAGSITTNYNPNGANRGNGITGFQSEWTRAAFPLASFAGDDLYLRFTYSTDTYVEEEGIYFDNITPLSIFESFEMIATAIEDTFYTVSKEGLEEPTRFSYLVRAIDEQGDVSPWSLPYGAEFGGGLSAGRDGVNLPEEFAFESIYPNPFNPTASLRVALPVAAETVIRVFDLLGREMVRSNAGVLPAGWRNLHLDGSSWSSGIYFVSVEMVGVDGSQARQIRKAVLVK